MARGLEPLTGYVSGEMARRARSARMRRLVISGGLNAQNPYAGQLNQPLALNNLANAGARL